MVAIQACYCFIELTMDPGFTLRVIRDDGVCALRVIRDDGVCALRVILDDSI